MRILFVTGTRIGDAVLSTGLLAHLVERHPGARFTIVAGPEAAPLFAAVPGKERVIALAKQRLSLHWLALYRRVAWPSWDIVVDLRGSALAFLLRARERRMMGKGAAEEHRVRQLARLFGLEPPPAPQLWTAPEHEARAAALLPPGAPVLAIGPAANWPGKQWPAERFAELALRLTGPGGPLPGARVAVLAAAHERAQAAPLLRALPPTPLHRQRYRHHAHRCRHGDADPGPVRPQPRAALRALGAAQRRGAHGEILCRDRRRAGL